MNILIIGRPTSLIIDSSHVEAAKFAGMLCFRNMFDTPVLGQFLSDFVWVKSNVSPWPSTFTYPIFEKSDF